MSAGNKDENDKNPYKNPNICIGSAGGMTPSIITTINNTSPTPPITSNNNNSNTISRTKRNAGEPYESYIEDSFVGHWEREDDDIDEEYGTGHGNEDPNHGEKDESVLHPSNLEFDFDSFGPESFIYTPTAARSQAPVEKESAVKSVEGQLNAREDSQVLPSAAQTRSDHIEKSHVEVSNIARPGEIITNPLDYLVDTAQIDLKVIEPYKKVISHAGYSHHFDPSAPAAKPGEPAPAIIVFSACYLPDRSRRDYNYVMDHLFLYVLSSLHELIADDYILIYLHNTQPSVLTNSLSTRTSALSNLVNGSTSATNEDSQSQNNLPTFTWMKRCYQMIDRKLRKNLKLLYLVKPTFWLKTIVIMCRPFISTKFSKKLRFVENMDGLKRCLPVNKLILPASAENI